MKTWITQKDDALLPWFAIQSFDSFQEAAWQAAKWAKERDARGEKWPKISVNGRMF